ncbi:FkbM family methyltransferase [bacterium]|nr:FkbM family methyltransferase [bacterium]
MSLNLVSKYFQPSSVLDIGCNTGQFYHSCKSVFPSARYYLVEGNYRCEPFIRTLGSDYSIALLSDDIKTVDFYVRKNELLCTGNSIYRENTTFFTDDQIIVEKLSTTTLDLLLPDSQFDLIKIDVQGSEVDIIRGGMNLVSKAKGLLLEVSLVEYNFNAPRKDDVMKFMKTIGYEPKELIGNIGHPIDGSLIQEDILFINKSILDNN